MLGGICCLRPGVKGLSENIFVSSIVGRFLEHGRIYVFGNGGKFMSDQNLVFMSSADLMPRNLLRRVETFIPLENKTVREQALKQVMYASFTDRENKWSLEKDGKYFKYFGDQTSFSSHSYFMKNPSLSGQGSLSEVYKKSNTKLLKNQKK